MINNYNSQATPSLPIMEKGFEGHPINLDDLIEEFTFITTSINAGQLDPNDPVVRTRIGDLQKKIIHLKNAYNQAANMGMIQR